MLTYIAELPEEALNFYFEDFYIFLQVLSIKTHQAFLQLSDTVSLQPIFPIYLLPDIGHTIRKDLSS